MALNRLIAMLRGHREERYHNQRIVRIERSAIHPTALHLTALPIEILQHIATYLPLESEAALALTCHHMKDMLSMRSWFHLSRNLRGNGQHILSGRWLFLPAALENLLILLARDMKPGTAVVCSNHLIIHRRGKLDCGLFWARTFKCRSKTLVAPGHLLYPDLQLFACTPRAYGQEKQRIIRKVRLEKAQ